MDDPKKKAVYAAIDDMMTQEHTVDMAYAADGRIKKLTYQICSDTYNIWVAREKKASRPETELEDLLAEYIKL